MKCLILLLISAGCGPIKNINELSCSDEQHEKVIKETNYCKQSVGAIDSLSCYSHAMFRNCEIKK